MNKPPLTNTKVSLSNLLINSFIHSSTSYVHYNFKYTALTFMALSLQVHEKLSDLSCYWRKNYLNALIFNGECYSTCLCKMPHRSSRVFRLGEMPVRRMYYCSQKCIFCKYVLWKRIKLIYCALTIVDSYNVDKKHACCILLCEMKKSHFSQLFLQCKI